MAKRILSVLVVLGFLVMVPIVGAITLMIKFIAYELIIFSPVWILTYLYVKNPVFRRSLNKGINVIGRNVCTFIVRNF